MRLRCWFSAVGSASIANAAALFQKQQTLSRGVPPTERSDFPESVTRAAAWQLEKVGSSESPDADSKQGRVIQSAENSRSAHNVSDDAHSVPSEALKKQVTSTCACNVKDDPDCDCILDEKKKGAELLAVSSNGSEDGDDCECINGKSVDPDCECPPLSEEDAVVSDKDATTDHADSDESCYCERDDPDCDCILGESEKIEIRTPAATAAASSAQEDRGDSEEGQAVSTTENTARKGEEETNEQSASRKSEPQSSSVTRSIDSIVNLSNISGRKQTPQVINNGPVPAAPAPVAAPQPVAPPVQPAGSVAVAQPVAVDPVQAKYDELMGRIKQLRDEIAMWSDHPTWNQKIVTDKLAVEKETTPALADMLADIRYELHQLAVPVFVEVLTDKLEILLAQEKDLKKELENQKKGLAEDGEWEKFGGKAGPKEKQKGGPRIEWPTMLILFLVGIIVVGLVYTVTQRSR